MLATAVGAVGLPMIGLILLGAAAVFFCFQKRKKKNKDTSQTQPVLVQPTLQLPEKYLQKLDVFPEKYNRAAQEVLQGYLTANREYLVDSRGSHKQMITDAAAEKVAHLEKRRNARDRVTLYGVIGGISGFYFGLGAIFSIGFVPGALIWVALVLGGRLLGRGVESGLERKIKRVKKTAEEDITALQTRYQAENDAAEKRTQASMEAYRKAFAQAAQEKSLSYVDSPLVESISAWCVKHLRRQVEAADRSDNQSVICVSVRLSVLSNKVFLEGLNGSGLLECYDFDKNRVVALTSPLQIAAIAHVLGARVQAGLQEAFETDPCGSVPMVELQEEKTTDKSAQELLVYKAANENYKMARQW